MTRRFIPLLAATALVGAAGLTVTATASASVGDIPTPTTVPVSGAGPNGVAINSDDTSVWTANFDSDNVSVLIGGAVVATVDVGDGPYSLALDPQRTLAYVTNYYDGTLSVIDRTSRTVTNTVEVGNFPTGIDVAPDGSLIYVANFGTDSVSVLNSADLSLNTVIPVGSNPWGVAADPNGGFVAVTNSGGAGDGGVGSVSLISASTLAVTNTINVGNNPTGVTVSGDGNEVFVANSDDATLSRIDLSGADPATTSVSVTGTPMGVDLAANEHALLVTNTDAAQVMLVDPDTLTVLSQTISVGDQPRSIAGGPDGQTAYVANFGSNNLTTITWARPQQAPNPPTGATAVAGVQSATVTWTAPTDPGTSPIQNYTVRSTTSGASCTVPVGRALSCTVSGLTAGVPLTFTVTATNAVGESDPSAPSNSVTPLPSPGPGPGPVPVDKPSAPTEVSAVAGIEAADVSWTASSNPGSSALQFYVVTGTPGGDTCQVAATATPECTVTGLNPGVPVTFTVVAYNKTSASDPSVPSAPVTPDVHPGAPSAPLNVSAVQGTGSTITATWERPNEDGHSAITGYEAIARAVDGSGWDTCDTNGDLTCTISGLQAGETYTVVVTASNNQGTSPLSDPSEQVFITQKATVAHVSSAIPVQSFQQVIVSPGAPAAKMTSKTPSTCVVQGGRAVFVAKGVCQLVVTQSGFPQLVIKTNIGGSAQGSAKPLKQRATVTFSSGSSTLSAKAKQTLDKIAPQLKKSGTVTVVGYASKAQLAKSRAQAVASYLKGKKVSITAQSADTSTPSTNSGVVRTAPKNA